MKIRRTMVEEKQCKVFLYENKKELFFLVAIPDLHWSEIVTYDDTAEDLKQRMITSINQDFSIEELELLSQRIYQWTREM